MKIKILITALVSLCIGVTIGPSFSSADEGTDGSIIGPDSRTITIPEGSFLGQCTVVTPPISDPCEQAAQLVQYVALNELGKGVYHAKWVKDNPGENARLLAHLANPQCGKGVGLVQDMKTHYGAALFALTQVWACLPQGPPRFNGDPTPIHPRELPLRMGVPDPPLDPKRTDKTPPTAPGPITVQP